MIESKKEMNESEWKKYVRDYSLLKQNLKYRKDNWTALLVWNWFRVQKKDSDNFFTGLRLEMMRGILFVRLNLIV